MLPCQLIDWPSTDAWILPSTVSSAPYSLSSKPVFASPGAVIAIAGSQHAVGDTLIATMVVPAIRPAIRSWTGDPDGNQPVSPLTLGRSETAYDRSAWVCAQCDRSARAT